MLGGFEKLLRILSLIMCKVPENYQWFAMRDLKHRHSKEPAYKMFEKMGIRYFTPTEHRLVEVGGKKVDRVVPIIQDMLFVYDTREHLDPIIEKVPTLQYRYKRGEYNTPIIVRSDDMERFIYAINSVDSPKYYSPDEITPEMRKRKIRIIGGKLDGFTGTLVTMRGSKTKRLLLELPMLLAATVVVEPDFIQLIK